MVFSVLTLITVNNIHGCSKPLHLAYCCGRAVYWLVVIAVNCIKCHIY